MQELEKILEEIKENSIIVATSKEHYIHPQNGRYVEEVVMLDCVEDIICKHLSREKDTEITRSSRDNDGWIPVERELPEDDIDVLITYADVDDERETGIDITTYGDATLGGNKLDYKEWRNPFPYFKGNYKVIAWRPLPDPYRPERSNDEKE